VTLVLLTLDAASPVGTLGSVLQVVGVGPLPPAVP
jgi:hypothetical protein